MSKYVGYFIIGLQLIFIYAKLTEERAKNPGPLTRALLEKNQFPNS